MWEILQGLDGCASTMQLVLSYVYAGYRDLLENGEVLNDRTLLGDDALPMLVALFGQPRSVSYTISHLYPHFSFPCRKAT